jgi:hypothetical protein
MRRLIVCAVLAVCAVVIAGVFGCSATDVDGGRVPAMQKSH